MRLFLKTSLPSFAAGCVLLAVSCLSTVAGSVNYERDVAPVLRSYCAGCHNDADLSGGLSVERYASLRKGGTDEGDPIRAGKPAESFLIRSLEGHASPKMPPKDEPKVPATELETLKRWIAEGAPGPKKDESILQTLSVPHIATKERHPPAVTALARSADGRFLAVARYASVELQPGEGGRIVKKISGLPGKVNAVHFSPDGKQLVAASGIVGLSGVARLYAVPGGQLIREFAGHRDSLQDAEFSPDGRILATAGYDKTIRLWKVETGEMLREIAVHNGAVFDLAFDPSGAVLASASADQTVKLWRVSDGLRLDTLNQPQGELYRVSFSPDGHYIIAAGADKRLHLWRWVSREQPALNPVVASRFAHDTAIQTISFSSDGSRLITSAADRSVKLWSFPDLQELQAFPAQPDVVTSFANSGKPDRFLAGRMDGVIGVMSASKDQASPGSSNPVQALSKTLSKSASAIRSQSEQEPNNTVAQGQSVEWPVEIKGMVEKAGDADLFRFHARAGETLTLAVEAARAGSKLDSRIEVLHLDGTPVEQVVLQAVRDSWFTFRGRDSDSSDDFRLHNWTEMELDQYLYADGEVVRLWLYPRGPDSGFKLYPGSGKRHTSFFTTALTHALNAPCYIVVPSPAGSQPVPNGLPIFRLNYENDDDPSRRWGSDSILLFTAPKEADYLARLTDVRGFGGKEQFHYSLQIRSPKPDFTVAIDGMNPKVSPGSARELRFNATRSEGFDGPIRIEIQNLPPGFTTSAPLEIEAGQESAIAIIHADSNATTPTPALAQAVRVSAVATIDGEEVRKELGALGEIQIGPQPKVVLTLLPGSDLSVVKESPDGPLEFSIRPGQTISAKIRAERRDFTGRIELGGDDSGRNLPHGVYIDNIGLNGLLIVEGQNEREFFITASPIAKPGLRSFHLRTTVEGTQASPIARLRVLPPLPAGTTTVRQSASASSNK